MARTRSGLRRGSALIPSLGAVGLLSLLVATFAATTRLERRASRNYTDGERTRLLAWSGVERAKFELRRAAAAACYPLPWLAYYTDSPVAPPLERARKPSFRMDLSPTPRAFASAGSPLPWPSGTMGSTYYRDPDNRSFGGDYYVLRVTDNNSQVFLNDANPHLGKMLDNLGRAAGAPRWKGLGARILGGRPAMGFRRVEELKFLLAPEDYEAIAELVCCSARVDRKVVECGEQPQGSGAAFRRSRLVFQSRAPINVNLAPFPVLVAALAGIGYGGVPGAPREQVSFEQASALASAFVHYRQDPVIATSAELVGDGQSDPALTGSPASPKAGFQKWAELARFLQVSGLLSSRLQSAVLANANPNTDLNRFEPDLAIYRPVDKYDLTAATTELCFASGGIFTIESLGIMLGPDGEPVSQAKVRSVVRVFERYLETTQRDFEQDRIDPPSPLLPGLRDVTTLPEFRNVIDDPLAGPDAEQGGLRAADFDGQVTFNAIPADGVASLGEPSFVGFLGRDLNGICVDGSTLRNRGSARGDIPPTARPTGLSVYDPRSFDEGTDLYPLGARVGHGSRYLAYDQVDGAGGRGVMTVRHANVPQRGLTMPWKKKVSNPDYPKKSNDPWTWEPQPPVSATIPSWEAEWINAQTFELWYKPSFPDKPASRDKQVILAWTGGEPRRPDMSTASSDVAGAVSGITYGAHAECKVWLEPVPGRTPAELTLRAEVSVDRTPASSGPFRTVLSGPIAVRAGTWHHVALAFHAVSGNDDGPEHVQLF
ncbi:hypothetical protein HY251_05395, partial [bacterium]|nr:hypothetical protein [bacterium]